MLNLLTFMVCIHMCYTTPLTWPYNQICTIFIHNHWGSEMLRTFRLQFLLQAKWCGTLCEKNENFLKERRKWMSTRCFLDKKKKGYQILVGKSKESSNNLQILNLNFRKIFLKLLFVISLWSGKYSSFSFDWQWNKTMLKQHFLECSDKTIVINITIRESKVGWLIVSKKKGYRIKKGDLITMPLFPSNFVSL